MIDLYYWATPNGHKITIFLEEAGIPYLIHPVDISANEQFKPEFLKINPNNKIPAIVDKEPTDGGAAVTVFESGAVLLYLALKYKKFLPSDMRDKFETLECLFWQVGGLGPMAGQNHHFTKYAPEKIPYAIERYTGETARLYGVLDQQLSGKEWVAGNQLTIADMAIYPWIVPYEMQNQNLASFPHLRKWFFTMQDRPSVIKAYAVADRFKK